MKILPNKRAVLQKNHVLMVRYVHCGYLMDLLLKKTQHTFTKESQILKILMLREERPMNFKCRKYNFREEEDASVQIPWYHESINILKAIRSLVKAI